MLNLNHVPVWILHDQQLSKSDQFVPFDNQITLGLVLRCELANTKRILNRLGPLDTLADAFDNLRTKLFHSRLGFRETRHDKSYVTKGVRPLSGGCQAFVFGICKVLHFNEASAIVLLPE